MFGISIANLLGLSVAFAAPLLIFAYLRKQKYSPTIVPSLIILKKIAKRKTLQKKFKPPINFFFELLALLLLALAVANPVYLPESTQVAIVFDNTLSMKAQSPNGEIIEQAKIKLEDWLNQQSGNNIYDLYLSAPNTNLVAENLSARQVKSNLVNVQAIESSDRIASTAREIASQGKYQQLLIVSDRDVDYLDSDPSINNSTVIRNLSTTKQFDNIFIKDAKIITTPAGNKNVAVSVSALGLGLKSGKVKLLQGASELSSQNFSFSGAKTATVNLDLPRPYANKRDFQIVIQADNNNSLLEDDEFYLVNDESSLSKIALITPSENRTAYGLEFIPGFSIQHLRPSEYANLSDEELKNFSLLIFHRTAPSAVPSVATLLILPPDNNPFFQVTSSIADPKISSFNTNHLLTSYLKLEALAPSQAITFDTPTWAQSVIGVEQGAVLVAGESRGIRFVACGFELLPFESRKTPAISILTLNLLRWLSNSKELAHSYRTFDSIALGESKTWIVSRNGEVIKSLETGAKETTNFTFETAGIYSITSIAGSSEASLQKSTKIYAVNSNFVEESNTYDPSPITIEPMIAHSNIDSSQTTVLWPLLTKIALAMLFLDLLFRARRKKTSEVGA